MGIYLPTGRLPRLQGQGGVAAAGPYAWMYGWNTVAPRPSTARTARATWMQSPQARLQNAGHGVLGERPHQHRALGLSCSYNGGIGADAQGAYHYVCDKDGVYWMKDISEAEMTRGRFIREIAKGGAGQREP